MSRVDAEDPRARARKLRRNSTDAERRLWRELRSRRFLNYKFRRQHVVGPFIADFLCASRFLIIELDGSQHAMHADHDASRTRLLRAYGYRVVRFWNNDVLGNLPGVLETIVEALERGERRNLEEKNPSPRPSPR